MILLRSLLLVLVACVACEAKAPGGAAPGTGTGRPAPPPVKKAKPPPPAPGSRAGSPDLLKPLSAAAHAAFEKGANTKDHAAAVKAFDAAIRAQPSAIDLYWHRAIARVRVKDAKGALADFEKALFGDYPRYFQLLTAAWAKFEDLGPTLDNPPYRAKLDAIVAASRAEHARAYERAVLLLASKWRLRRDAKRPLHVLGPRGGAFSSHKIIGDQGVYGYLPATGRYVSVAQGVRGAVGGFIASPDRKLLAYLWLISAGVGGDPGAGFRTYFDANVVVVDLKRVKQIDTREGAHVVEADEYYPTRAAVALYPRGVWVFDLKTRGSLHTIPEAGLTSRRKWQLSYDSGFPERARPRRGEQPIDRFVVRACKTTTHPRYRGVEVKAKVTTVGSVKLGFPCAGRAWADTTGQWVAFAPRQGCQRAGKPMSGLWRWHSRAKAWRSIGPPGVSQIRWLADGALLAQREHRLLYIDASGKKTRLAGASAYLSAALPQLSRCGVFRKR